MEYHSCSDLLGVADRRLQSLREGKAFWGFAAAFFIGIMFVSEDFAILTVLGPLSVWFWHCLNEKIKDLEKSIQLLKNANEQEEKRLSKQLEWSVSETFIDIVRGVF
jgi:hypothetical protein